MKRVGLAHDVNRAVPGLPGAEPASERVAQQVHLEFVDVPQNPEALQGSSDVGTNLRRNPMAEEKQQYIVRLMAKYGDDVAKMAHDRKRNPQQFTQQRLRKMIEKYEGLSDQWRVVPPPPPKS